MFGTLSVALALRGFAAWWVGFERRGHACRVCLKVRARILSKMPGY